MLDIRYNGGGYLDIASEVAYMIAGPGATTGRTFERTVFNDKYPTTDPVTRQALTPVPFHATSQGFSGPSGQALPTLNLPRVTVLTSANTCSASESIVNSLRGVGVQVIEIGSTTCGKPYGFYPQDNCGTTYFSIEFQGVNDQGFGDYPDGFSPANATGTVGVQVPGCSVADDFSHALGDRQRAPVGGGPRLSRRPRLPGGDGRSLGSGHDSGGIRDRRAAPQVALAREPHLPTVTTTSRARRARRSLQQRWPWLLATHGRRRAICPP